LKEAADAGWDACKVSSGFITACPDGFPVFIADAPSASANSGLNQLLSCAIAANSPTRIASISVPSVRNVPAGERRVN